MKSLLLISMAAFTSLSSVYAAEEALDAKSLLNMRKFECKTFTITNSAPLEEITGPLEKLSLSFVFRDDSISIFKILKYQNDLDINDIEIYYPKEKIEDKTLTIAADRDTANHLLGELDPMKQFFQRLHPASKYLSIELNDQGNPKSIHFETKRIGKQRSLEFSCNL